MAIQFTLFVAGAVVSRTCWTGTVMVQKSAHGFLSPLFCKSSTHHPLLFNPGLISTILPCMVIISTVQAIVFSIFQASRYIYLLYSSVCFSFYEFLSHVCTLFASAPLCFTFCSVGVPEFLPLCPWTNLPTCLPSCPIHLLFPSTNSVAK